MIVVTTLVIGIVIAIVIMTIGIPPLSCKKYLYLSYTLPHTHKELFIIQIKIFVHVNINSREDKIT